MPNKKKSKKTAATFYLSFKTNKKRFFPRKGQKALKEKRTVIFLF